ncbi:hypothetical protein TRAPUB_13815 [Trametes pubescens]|uniref:Uncharacterized protein n=1 Tax=Trametes pubescens TaxID=154538 RepID=A0A1M2VQ82_TRAPU|nr:hypothetical protein TRAPUB_13815 [Trametes pubescens]
MYVYNGKLDYSDYAKDECFTIVFPAGFALEDPLGSITAVTKTEDEYKVTIPFDWYSFDGVIAADFRSPKNAPGVLSDGQAAPTTSRFKEKFTNLIAGANAGDVRFLYVDTHGTIFPDKDGSGETDSNDEGWTMARGDDGMKKEVVYDDWLVNAIRANLKPGVNLTLLTSSCMGGGMLDTHTAMPGVLLAGCHEMQFNVKALQTKDGRVDPWMYAIVTTIKNQKFIKNQLNGGTISAKYKGPSPSELKPVLRDQALNTSNQDPQLIFYSGWLDPDEERFLFPFVAPRGGHAEGESVRFPEDQYAHGGEL